MLVLRGHCGLSVCIVRMLHTLLTFGILLTLIVKRTGLREAIDGHDILYCSLFFGLVIVSLVFYFLTCLTDPGYVPISTCSINNRLKDEVNGSEEEVDDVRENDQLLRSPVEQDVEAGPPSSPIKLRRCGFCDIEQPLRARHCEECGRCVSKYDHHCPWLETCIGERNHKFFWLFTGSKALLIWWSVAIVWPCFTFNERWPEWFQSNVIYLIDICVLGVGGFVVSILFCCHTYLMATNMTSWEMVSRHRITYLKTLDEEINPFHEGYYHNIYYFLCSMASRKWDQIYTKHYMKITQRS